MRQVTHALLTRPPLSYESLGFIITPFDLHVLSTPPAFILSQDQTLMLLFCFVCGFFKKVTHLFYVQLPCLHKQTHVLKSIGTQTFRLSHQNLLAYPNFTVRFVVLLFFFKTCSLKFFSQSLIASESSGLHYCLFVKVQFCCCF